MTRGRPRDPDAAPAAADDVADTSGAASAAAMQGTAATRAAAAEPAGSRAETAAGPAWLRDGRLAVRGHDEAIATVAAWGRDRVPHAILVAGPASIGKTTLARDLAAALLCVAGDGEPVPCGRCRACHRVISGNHPDLHVLLPAGPGRQVRIGGPGSPEPGVRELVTDLALRAAEGGARIAIIESAHRMNEDAQNALLRTLEEPPPGVVIVLCADDEDRLLPTIRSRCVRVRLGPVASRSIEGLLGELGLADPPTAARLARLAEGRPGVAVALAMRPDAVRAREELGRRLLDIAREGPAARLGAATSLLAAARDASIGGADEALSGSGSGHLAAVASGRAGGRGGGGRGRGRGRGKADTEATAAQAGPEAAAGDGETEAATSPAEDEAGPDRKRRAPASERREAARSLIDAWRLVARDATVARAGGRRELRDPSLMDEVRSLAERLAEDELVAFLGRLDETERLVEANASPELAIDTLLLAWPHASGEASCDTGRGRFEATVSGRVQGVGFRYYVLDTAAALGLDGWVANLPDGTVACVAEGSREALVALESALRSGPAGSRVDAVRIAWTGPVGIGPGFHIRSYAHGGD